MQIRQLIHARLRRLFLLLVTAILCGCGGGGGGGGGTAARIDQAAPTLSALVDQTVEANSMTMAIRFNVGDDLSIAAALDVAATAADPSLVAATGLALTDGGTARTLTITPQAEVTGSTTVTLTVTDEAGRSTTGSFVLSVVPQQTSFTSFSRAAFADDPNAEPRPLNARDFQQDADVDSFNDLL